MKKRVIFTVTNDLSYDQRMARICTTLGDAGYDITLVGRKKRCSDSVADRSYRQVRLYCFFEKGKLFYLEYNIRLFFFLLFQSFDIACGIDLDTLLPVYLTARLRGKTLVYDAHEYFTEMEEVVARPAIKKAWSMLERTIVPKVKYAYTVSDGYARMFKEKYGTDFQIVRNATVLNGKPILKKDDCYILYQGSVNVGRGLEALIEAMPHINCKLYICGQGDVYDDLKAQTQALGLENKVKFWGYIQPEDLKEFTYHATIGITLFTNAGLSNQYSLANRFFDYMHAAVPQVAMSYPEYQKMNSEFEVADLLQELTPETISTSINRMLTDREYYKRLRDNCLRAREVYNWQNEAETLKALYGKIG
ncbi:MAG: glycosyltransferase family 4 protein [Salibacteraceae bacterium]